MGCLLNCGGCAVDGPESDEAFEKALDAPVPAHCPQVLFNPEALRASSATCTQCGGSLDEDGRCVKCSTDQWVEDDIKARREKPFVDDAESHGPEC